MEMLVNIEHDRAAHNAEEFANPGAVMLQSRRKLDTLELEERADDGTCAEFLLPLRHSQVTFFISGVFA